MNNKKLKFSLLCMLILLPSLVFEFNNHFNNVNDEFTVKIPETRIKIGSATPNLTSYSLNLIHGNLLYTGLLQNPNFTSPTAWSFTNSSNVTTQWSPGNQNGWIHHQSNNSQDLSIQNTTHLAEDVNLILYFSISNDLTSTYNLDGQDFGILEGAPFAPYNINTEFAFSTSVENVTYLEVNFYGSASSGDSLYWQIYNYRDSQWNTLLMTNFLTEQWYNQSLTQNPHDPVYIDSQGNLRLRIYDNDTSDNTRTWFYIDYLEIQINGTSVAPKIFNEIASINQTFSKEFTTDGLAATNQTVLFSEGFESGSYATNGWNVQSGGGILNLTTWFPYNGSISAHFSGDSTMMESTLTKTLNLSGLINASLSFYIRVESLEASDFLYVDIYDGAWHSQVRSYTGNFGYQLETIDLSSYNHIAGFQIRFRGHMSHPTADHVRLDDIIITALIPFIIPTVFLNFSYYVEEALNVELDLQIRLWNSSRLIGTLWSTQVSGPTSLINLSVGLNPQLDAIGVYNISFEVQAQVSTTSEVNFSIYYDSISITCLNVSDASPLYYISNEKDNRVLNFFPDTNGLDIRFNFSILEGNMSLHIYYNAPLPITLWVYNFSSLSWINLTNLQASNFNWMNLSSLENFDYVDDDTNTLILRYTNRSAGLLDAFLIDYHSITVRTYSSSLAHVQTNPQAVQPGQIIKVQVNFTANSLDRQINGASIFTNYTDDQYIFQELSNGIYNITFYTDLATPGQKIVEITAVKEGFDNSSIITLFNLTGFPSELYFISGVTFVNGSYWVDPAPFPDDQDKAIQVYFNGSFGGIDGAIIRARLNISGQIMPFQDLGNTISHLYDGFYNITVDTSSLKDGQIGRIDITVSKEGYLSPALNCSFTVLKIPTSYLLLETDLQNLTVIEGESIRIGASFKDTLHNTVLFDNPSDGNLTWRINSPGADVPHLMTKLLTVYVADIELPAYNITPGIYNLTIESWALSNYADTSKNILLEVLPKSSISFSLISTPLSVLAGSQFKIFGNLTLTTGTPIVNTPILFRLSYEYRSVPSIIEIPEIRVTNSSGIAELTISADRIYKSVQIISEYSGNATVQNKTIVSSIIPIVVLNSSITIDPLPAEILEGETLNINARLLINGTPAENKTITFIISYEGSIASESRTAITDSSGIATISLKIPSGVTKLFISAQFSDEVYEAQNSTSTETNIISYGTLILRYAPIWLTILLITLATILGFYLNKRLLHFTKFQKASRKMKEQVLKKGEFTGMIRPTREDLILELLEETLPKSKYKPSTK